MVRDIIIAIETKGGCKMYKNNLKEIRKSKGITMKKLSEISGVSMGYICHLEKGSRENPSKEIMEKIAVALEKTVTEIFF